MSANELASDLMARQFKPIEVTHTYDMAELAESRISTRPLAGKLADLLRENFEWGAEIKSITFNSNYTLTIVADPEREPVSDEQ